MDVNCGACLRLLLTQPGSSEGLCIGSGTPHPLPHRNPSEGNQRYCPEIGILNLVEMDISTNANFGLISDCCHHHGGSLACQRFVIDRFKR